MSPAWKRGSEEFCILNAVDAMMVFNLSKVEEKK